MASLPKVLQAILSGSSDANFRFGSITRLLKSMGFREHIRGDHHIFTRDGVEEIINLQPLRDGKAKAYQVRQVRQIITKYGLNLRLNP